MDEETTAHTGGLMVVARRELFGGLTRANGERGYGRTAVRAPQAVPEVDRAAPERSGSSSSPQPHKPVAVWARVRGSLAEGRGKTQRPGGHHRWRWLSVAQPRGTSRVERLS